VSQLLLALALLAGPESRTWLGISLVQEGTCVKVAAMALNGPYAKGGGKLIRCIARIAGQESLAPSRVLAMVSMKGEGQVADIEVSDGRRFRVQFEREPPDSWVQICTHTSKTQIVVSVASTEDSRERFLIYKSPVKLSTVILSEQLSKPVKVLVRTCASPIARLDEHPSPDLELTFGSTVMGTRHGGSAGPSSKSNQSAVEDAL